MTHMSGNHLHTKSKVNTSKPGNGWKWGFLTVNDVPNFSLLYASFMHSNEFAKFQINMFEV